MKFYPCACSKEPIPNGCDFVLYHPQDITKGERLALESGYDVDMFVYKLCDTCKFICTR